jgi:hypothetical protein
MTEREMEDLLWEYPELLLGERLRQYRRQQSSGVSRADLVFTDSLERILVIELKKGTLSRDAIPQAMDHFGGIKSQNSERIVESMVIANRIPPERKSTLENYHIEWREIPELRFREVAADKGYVFQSEQVHESASTPPSTSTPSAPRGPLAAPSDSISSSDGWEKIVWKDDCTAALRKGAAELKRHGEYLNPTDIHGMILTHLRDQQVHSVADLLAAVGGSPKDIKEKIKHVAHRGNCFHAWEIYRSSDWQYVRLSSAK